MKLDEKELIKIPFYLSLLVLKFLRIEIWTMFSLRTYSAIDKYFLSDNIYYTLESMFL